MVSNNFLDSFLRLIRTNSQDILEILLNYLSRCQPGSPSRCVVTVESYTSILILSTSQHATLTLLFLLSRKSQVNRCPPKKATFDHDRMEERWCFSSSLTLFTLYMSLKQNVTVINYYCGHYDNFTQKCHVRDVRANP